MKNWIKVLAVALISYSLIAGLLVPLGPGIVRSVPIKANAGDLINLEIETYNTHYVASPPQVYFKGEEDNMLKASNVEVISDQKITAQFDLPEVSPGTPGIQSLTLVVNSEQDGNAILPDALFLTTSKVSSTPTGWKELDQIELTIADFIKFPYRKVLKETIRNIYYHVSLWFAMILLFLISMVRGIQYLQTHKVKFDEQSRAFAEVGILFGLLGIVTGMLWANYTWGEPWSFDIKQNMAAIALLIYLAYFVLRSSINDYDKRYRIAAAYNIFAFVSLIPLLFVIPRLVDSLHPGSGGNPALGADDLDNTMRMVFYPAVIGWMLLGIWMSNLIFRYHRIHRKMMENIG